MVIEKLFDVLFRLKNSANSPSFVIHGDNLKRYHGKQTVRFSGSINTRESLNSQGFGQMEVNNMCVAIKAEEVFP